MDIYELKTRQLSSALNALMEDSNSLSSKAAGGNGWNRTDHLLAMVVDELRLANWQRTKDGTKGRNRPKPVSPLAERGTRVGKTDKSPAEVIDFLDRLHRRGKWQTEPKLELPM